MDHKVSGNTVMIRMFPGEDYISGLLEVCREIEAETAVVLSSIGQIREFTLGYFVGPGDYSPETFEDPFELISVSGIISGEEGIYTPHLHAVLGGSDKRVVGGHLIGGSVEITNETVLYLIREKVKRSFNEATGLMDLIP